MSFKPPQFWDALQHPREVSSDAVAAMEVAVDRYPYFQLLRTLIAKAKHDQQTPDAYAALGTAAVYAPDRRLLRQVFYDERTLDLPVTDDTTPAVPDPAIKEEPDIIVVDNTIRKEETPTDEILTEETDVEATITTEAPHPTVEEPPGATEPVAAEDNKEEGTPEETDSLREELAQTLQVLTESKEHLPDSAETTDADTPSVESAKTEDNSPLLDRLERVSEESAARSPAQSRQQDIIDRFVKANPSITRDAASERTNDTDLSANSTEFQDNVVTENLAEIMLKQGKTAKATELYQKLILKYPEKKAYFAQKIDQLTNN